MFHAEDASSKMGNGCRLMKVCIWLLWILSIFVGLFVSFVSYLSRGLGLAGTAFGEVVCIMGTLTLAICIAGMVLGIISMRKGKVKKALACALISLGYCAAIIAGTLIDDAVHTMQLEKRIAERNEQLYVESTEGLSSIQRSPDLHQEATEEFFVIEGR